MKPAAAWGLVALLAASSVAVLTVPAPVAGVLAVAPLALLRRGRAGYLAFATSTAALGALVLALAHPGRDLADLGPLALSRAGAAAGLAGALRLVALVGLNLALLSWAPAPRILDGLRLPPRATAVLAAVLIAAHDVGADIRRLALATRLDRTAEARSTSRGRLRVARDLLPAIVASSLRRAQARADALRLAGHTMPPAFVPTLAVAALVVASRLALAPIPHLKLTYLIVFLGGLHFGARVGAAAAAIGMAASDVLLSGLLPGAFVNVPAMAALGALGAAAARIDFAGPTRTDRAAGAMLAAAIGVFATLAFSVLADAATWLLLPEYRGAGWPALATLVGLGLAFNALPAAFNGALFAATVGPTQGVLRRILPTLHGTVPRPLPPATASSTAPVPAPPLK